MEAAQPIADAPRRISKLKPGTQHSLRNPVIIMLSGLPGTGKSYLAGKLAEHLPFMIVESDAVRKELFPKPKHSRRENTSVFGAIHYITGDLLKNKISVILDATNLEEKHRKTVYSIAERTGARLILVNVEAPPETVQKRLKARLLKRNDEDYSDATWAIYQKMKRTAEKISRSHYTVNTTEDITPVIEKIVKEANN